jgi:hypothetical protein
LDDVDLNSRLDAITTQEAAEIYHNGNNELKAIEWLQEGLKLFIQF